MFFFRKSKVDPSFYEVVHADIVINEIAVRFRLGKIPKAFSSHAEIELWVLSEEKRLARSAAYRLLALKAQSSHECRRKLLSKGFSDSVCNSVIEELKSLGYISDVDFERAVIQREFRKGHGPVYIEKKIRSLGFSEKNVRIVITEDDQRKAIQRLAVGLRKSAAAIQRRGFDVHLILSELKNCICND